MWDEPLAEGKDAKYTLIRNHKRCYSIKTAAQWPWKSATAKKCVTT